MLDLRQVDFLDRDLVRSLVVQCFHLRLGRHCELFSSLLSFLVYALSDRLLGSICCDMSTQMCFTEVNRAYVVMD